MIALSVTKSSTRTRIHNAESNNVQQECIPVGCVPADRWPYAGVCFPGGGGSGARRGLVLGGSGAGGVWCWGGLVPGGSGPRGGLVPGGLVPGRVYPSMHWGRPPPVDRHTPVKILPWPNFVAAGNNAPFVACRKVPITSIHNAF